MFQQNSKIVNRCAPQDIKNAPLQIEIAYWVFEHRGHLGGMRKSIFMVENLRTSIFFTNSQTTIPEINIGKKKGEKVQIYQFLPNLHESITISP